MTHPFLSVLKREFGFALVLEMLPGECYLLIAYTPIELSRVRALCRRYDVDVTTVTSPQPDSLCFTVPAKRTPTLALESAR